MPSGYSSPTIEAMSISIGCRSLIASCLPVEFHVPAPVETALFHDPKMLVAHALSARVLRDVHAILLARAFLMCWQNIRRRIGAAHSAPDGVFRNPRFNCRINSPLAQMTHEVDGADLVLLFVSIETIPPGLGLD